MAFFNSKPKKNIAFAMLGNPELLKAFIERKVFSNAGINLSNIDYVMPDELVSAIKETPAAKYILISEHALLGIKDGKYQIIKQIREINKEVVIVFFLNFDSIGDTAFEEFAFSNNVFHLYYADKNDSYDMEKVVSDIASLPPTQEEIKAEIEYEKQILEQKEASLKEKEAALDKQLEEADNRASENTNELFRLRRELAKEKENKAAAVLELEKARKEFEAEHEKLIADAKRAVSAQKAALQKEEVVIPLRKNIAKIGVFSLSRGAGSTYTALALAELYYKNGKKVALLEYDKRSDIGYVKKPKFDCYVPAIEDRKEMLLRLIAAEYDVIILDFGNVIPIEANGHLDDEVLESEEVKELFRCAVKVGVGFGDIWRVNILKRLLMVEGLDQYSTIYAIADYESVKASFLNDKKFSALQICDRNTNLIFDILEKF